MQHSRPEYQEVITNGTRRIIPDDEPVFLIRGQDIVGGAAVRAWADLAEKAGADAQIVGLARQHADKMDAWPKKKIPDLPKPIDFDFGDDLEMEPPPEPLYHCEGCSKPLYEGDKANVGEDVTLCEECAPTYADVLSSPAHFIGAETEESMTPEEARAWVDGHIAAGGSVDDKIVSVL